MGNSVTDFLNSAQGSASSIVISIISIVLAFFAYRWSRSNAKTSLVNSNSWETYKLYNSPEVLHGRRVARDVGKSPTWGTVRDLTTYQHFFDTYSTPGGQTSAGHTDPTASPDQQLHYLLNYYHQVGMLLQRGLLDEDFTLLLVGEGLMDRWNVVGRVPTLYQNSPYQGIYILYDRYKTWVKTRYSQLVSGPGKAVRDEVAAAVRAGQTLQA